MLRKEDRIIPSSLCFPPDCYPFLEKKEVILDVFFPIATDSSERMT